MKTLADIQSDVVRRARISSTDTTSIAAITTDANDACSIIAAQRNWDELYKKATISLALADGDKVYPLASDVDVVEQVRISAPTGYAKVLNYMPRKQLLTYIPDKSNNGTTTPNQWYFAEPTISTTNLETKNISFDTMPDQSYTVTYTYRAYPPTMTSTSYPFFDQNFHMIIEDYCLWKYAERNPDTTLNPDEFEAKWNDGVNTLMSAYNSKVVDNPVIPGPIVNSPGTFGSPWSY